MIIRNCGKIIQSESFLDGYGFLLFFYLSEREKFLAAYIIAVRSRLRLVDLFTATGLVFSFLVRLLGLCVLIILLNVSSFRWLSSYLPKLGCLFLRSAVCGLSASCKTPFIFFLPFLRLSKNESSLYPELDGFT